MVLSALERIRKYIDKLEKPTVGQVYHTKLKVYRKYKIKNYIPSAWCLQFVDYMFDSFKRQRLYKPVDRAKCTRIYREAYRELTEKGFITDGTVGKCYRWFRHFDDAKELCDEIFSYLIDFLERCAYGYCDESVAGLSNMVLTIRRGVS